MKLNILKLQYGGRPVYHSSVNPFSGAAIQDRQKPADSSSDLSILSKESENELVKNGIPVDVLKFFLMALDFESHANFGLGMNRSQLYLLRAYANLVILQAKYLNKAEEEAVKNGAWDEIAVSPRGYFYAINDKNQISKISFKNYDPSKYQALTIGELVEQRKFSPQLVDDSDIATIVGNSIGLEKISDYILNIVKEVGNSNTSLEAYLNLASIVGSNSKAPTLAELNAVKGLYNLFNLLGLDAVFKTKETVEDPNIKAAFAYIMSVLPNNMKVLLEGSYIALGGKKENAASYAAGLIETALLAGTDRKYAYDIDYDAPINKAIGTESGDRLVAKSDPNPKVHNLTMPEILFNGDLNSLELIQITDPSYKNRTAMNIQGTVIPSLVTDDNKSVSNLPLLLALSGKGLGKYLDYSKMWMGNLKISEGMLKNIVYTNAKAANVWLPVDYNQNIDWQSFTAFSAAEEEIRKKGETDPAKKNLIHMQKGSKARYDANNQLIPLSGVALFLMTHGYTIDDHIDEKNNPFIKELEGVQEDEIDALIESIYTKELKLKFGISGMDNKLVHDDIIAVPVFIKIAPNAAINAATFAGYGSQVDNQTLQQDMLMQKQAPQFTASGSELFL